MKILQCKLIFIVITFALLGSQQLQAMQQTKTEKTTHLEPLALDFAAAGKKRALNYIAYIKACLQNKTDEARQLLDQMTADNENQIKFFTQIQPDQRDALIFDGQKTSAKAMLEEFRQHDTEKMIQESPSADNEVTLAGYRKTFSSCRGIANAQTLQEIIAIQLGALCAAADALGNPNEVIDIAYENPLFADLEALEKNEFYQRGLTIGFMFIDMIEAFLKGSKSEFLNKIEINREQQLLDMSLIREEVDFIHALFYWKGNEKALLKRPIEKLIAQYKPNAETTQIVQKFFNHNMTLAMNIAAARSYHEIQSHFINNARYNFSVDAQFQAAAENLK